MAVDSCRPIRQPRIESLPYANYIEMRSRYNPEKYCSAIEGHWKDFYKSILGRSLFRHCILRKWSCEAPLSIYSSSSFFAFFDGRLALSALRICLWSCSLLMPRRTRWRANTNRSRKASCLLARSLCGTIFWIGWVTDFQGFIAYSPQLRYR